ncbi:MAG: hypothetical protein O2923_10785 [Verrucomicrobia bacterium]|nr:hypothetical protein [Verrucomicrobiota bacterium]MDA1085900.1 hypothetical protein [Verrucomicrobiota bacterium]
MPEPLSIGLCYIAAGYTSLMTYARGGNAISDDARIAADAATEVVRRAERSHVLFGQKSSVLSALREIADECRENGWDGEDACAVDPTAVFMAGTLLHSLPDDVPLPEFAPEPDGCISMDWIESRTRLFSLSIGATHRIAYSWLDGTDKGYAVAHFDGEKTPPRILDGIRQIADRGYVAIGS